MTHVLFLIGARAIIFSLSSQVAKTKERKKRVAARSAFALQNTHLHGTELGRLIDSLNE